MNYEIGDKIRVVFKTNLFVEGFVTKIQPLELKIVEDNSTITNINLNDIFYIKIFSREKKKDFIYENARAEAERRIAEITEERDNYSTNMFETYESLDSSKEGNYGLPSFSSLKVPKQYSDKKIRNKKQ